MPTEGAKVVAKKVAADGGIQLKGAIEILQGYANDALEHLPKVAIAIVVFLIFLILSKIAVRAVTTVASRTTSDRSLQNLFATVAKVGVIMIGVFASAAIIFPGLKAGDLVGVLGLSSVAIGFAFKDIFQNFFAGILILTQRPFAIGDQIKRGDLEGTVEDISIRNTVLKTYDGERLIVPNSELYVNTVRVFTAYGKRRTVFKAGIAYKEDIEKARAAIRSVLEGCEAVLKDPAPQIYVVEHGESSVNFDVRYWTLPQKADVMKTLDAVATGIKYAFDQAEIEIPFPYRTVELFDKTDYNTLYEGLSDGAKQMVEGMPRHTKKAHEDDLGRNGQEQVGGPKP